MASAPLRTRLNRLAASLTFQNQFHALNARIEQFKALVLSLNDPPHQTSTHRKRGILLTQTLLCCATIQLYARTEPRWDREGCEPLQAAIAAANAIEDANVPLVEYVDPVLGVSPFPLSTPAAPH